ncbi:hypothetical protein Q33_0052 [Lactococcus phage Q33]|uniref:Uncharacterized protein n=1 Tax=Lactococcus phage Q33 TaxID=254253 RepID=R9QND1_9CAUD|nr:hypothetical protein H1N73_gp51 [Lactococcus phage Q33]AFV51079.1 hypothetical protein Q33_0052 [Lactococcus phage Q33]
MGEIKRLFPKRGRFFLCYNIVGMFVRFHPIPRVKPFFGVAFFVCCKFTTILSET